MLNTKQTSSELFSRAASKQPRIQDLFSSSRVAKREAHLCFWPENRDAIALPTALIPYGDDLEALFADVATYHPQQSPISSCVHVLDSETASITGLEKRSLARHLAADDDLSVRTFVGLSIGEALSSSLALRATPELVSYAACRRTLSFAVARTKSIFPSYPIERLAQRWVRARELTRMESPIDVTTTVRTIAQLFFDEPSYESNSIEEGELYAAVGLYLSGKIGGDAFTDEMLTFYPELASHLSSLDGPFEGRIYAFERIAAAIAARKGNRDFDAMCIAFFCNQILPGSLSHFGLLAPLLAKHPSIVVWYGVFNGASPEFDWRSIYSGLGLKLARDVIQPFSFEARPVCDISLEELEVLSRLPLRSDLVKSTQQKACLVSLAPGVDLYMRLTTADDAVQADELESRKAMEDQERRSRVMALMRNALSLLDQIDAPPSSSKKSGRKSGGPRY